VRAVSQSRTMLRVIPDTTLRRLRSTPSYFFLIWRWSMWLYALVVILGSGPSYSPIYHTCVMLLGVTLLQTLVVTFYAPVFQPLLARLRLLPVLRIRPRIASASQSALEDEAELFTPLLRTRSRYRDIAIYALDVIICGLVTYYSGPFSGHPNFGNGSPFYRYGMSTAFAAALAYRYPGGIAAAIGYDLFILLGIFVPAPGSAALYTPNVIDIVGSLIDTPVAALLAAFIVSLLASYAQSKKREQENGRWQRALLSVGETIVRAGSDKERLLQKGAEQLCQGGHFDHVVIALINGSDDEHEGDTKREIESCVEVDRADSPLPNRSKAALEEVTRSGQKLIAFEPLSDTGQSGYGIARLYLPFLDGYVRMILGAESRRQQPFDSKQETFLTIAGAQLSVALDNMRLAEQTIQLAASAERSRIAREIHDGIAQLVYMLSLQAETCVAQSHRIAEAAEEDAELIAPLAERLAKLVTLSKQALWETRNYMFSLKPLMSGATTLEQMLATQAREFEAISGLPVRLEIDGDAQAQGEDRQIASRQARVGATIFRIVQEALTNAYKHAAATEVWIHLRHLPDGIEVTICDNGRGLPPDQSNQQEDRRIYSGHGLRGMRERAEELGGSFELGEAAAGGVKIRVSIPS
jgi:signal transduction histidine kinase